jgi:PKD repeat protein
VTEGGDWAVITYDDFEGGWGNYTDGGGDCYLYTGGTYAHQGSCAADIQDNSGTASSFYHTVGYNVSGYTELEVEFWYMPISMDRTGEDFWVQYYDGSTWQTVATFDKGVDFENNNFYHEVVAISSSQYNFPTNARLRFMCDASGNQDDVYIDEIEFRGMSAGPMPPVADFYGSPTSGVAPLEVTFTDQSSGNPTGWNWTFGDGGTSTIQNPLHTYTDPGTYTVSLTATNAYGNDTETKTGYITVTEASENTMHVDDITVTKESWWILRRGNATVKIVDASGNPVEGATVSGEWSGGASDKDNFTTGSNGTGSCVSDWLWGDATFTFCVTDVTKSGWTYDSDANVMTCADDAGNTYGALAGAGLTDIEEIESVIGRPLVTIAPNPFNPITRISFALPKASHVSLDIYNILGQHVENLADGQFEAGEHSVTWDATDDYGRKVSSGIYFFRITFNHRELITRKMILLK